MNKRRETDQTCFHFTNRIETATEKLTGNLYANFYLFLLIVGGAFETLVFSSSLRER